jgi:hypothetical protein
MEKTKKNIIMAIIINLIIWSAVVFIAWDIKLINRQIVSSLASSEKDLKKDESLRTIKKSLADNAELIGKINSYFVTPDEVVSFIELIENLGKESGVSLSIGSVTTGPDSKNKDDFKEVMKLRLETLGTWRDTYQFLSIIENLPYKETVEQVSLNLNLPVNELYFDFVSDEDVSRVWRGYFEIALLKIK